MNIAALAMSCPPDLESLHLARSLWSLRALWSLSRLRTTPNGVADSQLFRGAPSAYIKAGSMLLLGDRELTLPKKTKWRSVVFYVEVLRDAFIRGTLASTNINSLPTKQPGVHGPCAGSKHDEAYSECREQEVQVRSVSFRKENPHLGDHLQSSGNRRPQSCQQQNPDADRCEIYCVKPQLRCISNCKAATNNQWNSCG